MTQKDIFQTARNVLVGNCPEGQPRKASRSVLQRAAMQTGRNTEAVYKAKYNATCIMGKLREHQQFKILLTKGGLL